MVKERVILYLKFSNLKIYRNPMNAVFLATGHKMVTKEKKV